jgi:hypothetical protein
LAELLQRLEAVIEVAWENGACVDEVNPPHSS